MAETCAQVDPQNAEVFASQLEQIVTFGTRNAVRQLGDVPTVLDQFRRVLDDYEENTGDYNTQLVLVIPSWYSCWYGSYNHEFPCATACMHLPPQ